MGAASSKANPVRLIALGGLGEIGLNLMVLECAGRAIIVDCGLMFPEDRLLGNGVYVPDLSSLDDAKIATLVIVPALVKDRGRDHEGCEKESADDRKGGSHGSASLPKKESIRCGNVPCCRIWGKMDWSGFLGLRLAPGRRHAGAKRKHKSPNFP